MDSTDSDALGPLEEDISNDSSDIDLRKIFIQFFPRSVVKAISRKSIRPYEQGEVPNGDAVAAYFESLYNEIEGYRYLPDVPRAYNILDKGNGVPRIKPVLTFKDLAVYYFCCRFLENSISKGRVDRTFGGYSMGSVLRGKEAEEIAAYQQEWVDRRAEEASDHEYSASGSIRPDIWLEEWKEFQRLSYQIIITQQPKYAIKFDLSNFYDNIPLDRLEARLRKICKPDEQSVIDLLFVFLRYWNRSHEGYLPKSVGIPQDESGESSRLLANTYLQEYDRWMKAECDAENMIYLRYADDQILFGNDQNSLYRLMFRAGVFLRKMGLNINNSKVKFFDSINKFHDYWAYDMFIQLNGNHEPDTVENVTRGLLDRCVMQGDLDWKWDGVMRRIITTGIPKDNPSTRSQLLEFIFAPTTISRFTQVHFTKLYKSLTLDEQGQLLQTLDSVAPNVPFNQFHLELGKFYCKVGLKERSLIAIANAESRTLAKALRNQAY